MPVETADDLSQHYSGPIQGVGVRVSGEVEQEQITTDDVRAHAYCESDEAYQTHVRYRLVIAEKVNDGAGSSIVTRGQSHFDASTPCTHLAHQRILRTSTIKSCHELLSRRPRCASLKDKRCGQFKHML
jgi:hypothetical protein